MHEITLEATLVELADTLSEDFDVVELLSFLADRSVELLEVGEAGLTLLDQNGRLSLVAWSGDQVKEVEPERLDHGDGPSPECVRTSSPVVNHQLGADKARWPEWEERAVRAGFTSVNAFPLHRHKTVIGALTLFRRRPGPMRPEDVRAAQALASMATIAILQRRAVDEVAEVNAQLENALASRVVIEQAKGVLAASHGWEMDTAFSALRGFSRGQQRRLHDVAQALVNGDLDPAELIASGV